MNRRQRIWDNAMVNSFVLTALSKRERFTTLMRVQSWKWKLPPKQGMAEATPICKSAEQLTMARRGRIHGGEVLDSNHKHPV